MCEAASPLDILTAMRFSLSSLSQVAGTPGSYERRNAENVAKGIRADLDWCIAQLEAAGEGKKNMGIHPYPSKGTNGKERP